MSHQPMLPTAETPAFVRSIARAKHLIREAELSLKPFGHTPPNKHDARAKLKLAVRELEGALS